MTSAVLVLTDPGSPEASLRCQALASLICRVQAMDGQSVRQISAPADPTLAVTALAGAATVTSDNGELRYIPTRAARQLVAADGDGAWTASVASRHRKAVRRSAGALFTLPYEPDPALADPPADPLLVLITDWSPCPAACAVAVHPAHPASTGILAGERAAFTGRYCRHPLTGDLLPIWAADWVKPEFGTGAVLVNPGHDAMDLAFGRLVGLPIRFALAPRGFTGAPADWLQPPFIKSGVTVRTGQTDGLPYDQARAAYYDILAERGLAERYTDCGVGAFPVGVIGAIGAREADGQLHWDWSRRTVAAPDQPGEPVALTAARVLGAVEQAVREADLTVVAPSSQVESDVLALRLLLAEPGIRPAPRNAPDVLLVGNALPVKTQAAGEALPLALLVSAGQLDTAAVKPQQVEQCEQFIKVHQQLAGVRAAGPPATADVGRSASQIKSLLARRDPRQAFTHLYRLQKKLAKNDAVGDQDLARYLVLAYVIAGVTGPRSAQSLAQAWQHTD
jgi:leucyl-tRNA synthetase